jgi:uncharacterized protein (DUF1810 family)
VLCTGSPNPTCDTSTVTDRSPVRTLEMPDTDLERFHDGYRRHFDDALAEINGGRKRSHWMWFIFPQVGGLGTSPTAVHYAIHDRAEADAFVQHPVLGPGYRALVDAVWRQVIGGGVSLRELFGRPDDHKLVSSLTLFAGVASQLDEWAPTVAQANEILDQAEIQGVPRCVITRQFLVGNAPP